MPLAEQVGELRRLITEELGAAHDHYVRSKAVWRFLRTMVAEGHRFQVRSLETATTVTAEGLLALETRYINVYLAEAALQRYVSLLEDFVFGLLRLWLAAHPAGLPNKEEKQVRLAAIPEAADKEAIVLGVIDRELDNLKYGRPAAWFKYLEDRVRLGCPAADQIEQLAEVKASRDVLIHHRGIVNETYLDKARRRAPGRPRGAAGGPRAVPPRELDPDPRRRPRGGRRGPDEGRIGDRTEPIGPDPMTGDLPTTEPAEARREAPIAQVRGTRDWLADDYAALASLERTLLDRYAAAGYRPIRTPILEVTELHERKSGAGIVSKLFELADGRPSRLCLRPELTASVVRAFIDASEPPPVPWRVAASGPVFRYEREPGPRPLPRVHPGRRRAPRRRRARGRRRGDRPGRRRGRGGRAR